MRIVFHSDPSVTKGGFKATWKAVETSGKIKSPNYPSAYPNNVDEVTRAYAPLHSYSYLILLDMEPGGRVREEDQTNL